MAPTLTESTTGATTPVTFKINLTSTAATDTVVNYTVAGNVDYNHGGTGGKTFFSAADFGGTFPAGTVTVPAGQTTVSFTINVPNSALAGAPDKWLGVSLSAPNVDLIYNPTAQSEIINATLVAGPPAEPVIQLLPNATGGTALPVENAEALVQVGHDYTLNLGNVLGSASLPALQLAISNLAPFGSDKLSSAITSVTGSGFQVSGTQPPGSLASQGTFDNLYALPEAGVFGPQQTVLTIASQDVNDSGYLAALPDMTLTIEDNVVAPAEGIVTTSSIKLPNVRLGTAEAPQTIVVSNAAVSPAASLDVTITAGVGTTASGTVSKLVPGASDTSDLSAGLAAGTVGKNTGMVTLSMSSDLGNGVTVPALPNATVTLVGSVYREATAGVAVPSAIVHVGDPGTETITVTNTAATDGYSENLIANLANTTGQVASAATGSTLEIAPGASDSTSLALSFSTTVAGVISGTATLNLISDGGTGPGSVDGLGQIALAAQTIPISVTVDNYAQATISEITGGGTWSEQDGKFTLDLGTVTQGSDPYCDRCSEHRVGPKCRLARRHIHGRKCARFHPDGL